MTIFSKHGVAARLAVVVLASISGNALAQTVSSADDTVLKQIIIFGRHGVRSAALPATTFAAFAPLP